MSRPNDNPSANRHPDPAQIAALAAGMSPWRSVLIDDLRALCAIPSMRGEALPGMPYGADTAAALEKMLEIGKAAGARVCNLDNRCGYLEWGSGDRMVAVLAHLDVVPPGEGWTGDPFVPRIEGNRLIARGAIDDKGPAVAALTAIRALLAEAFDLPCRLRLIVGLDEENGSSCMAHYVRHAEIPDAGFTPDANFPVISAEKGICHLKIDAVFTPQTGLIRASGGDRPNMVAGSCTLSGPVFGVKLVTGTVGHASTPWTGDNAIDKAMRQVVADDREAGRPEHPYARFHTQGPGAGWDGRGLDIAGRDDSGPLTANVGLLEMDDRQASLTIDIRYPLTWRPEQWMPRLERRLADLADRDMQLTARLVTDIPPLSRPADDPLTDTLMSVYNRLTGSNAAPLAIGGGTYARTMPNVVAYGPVFPGDAEIAHQADEYADIDHLLAAAAIYRQALRELALIREDSPA